jgi:hypothetical protein
MASESQYGKAPLVAAWVLSVLGTFLITLLFAQSVWSHNQVEGGDLTAATATSGPSTTQSADGDVVAATPMVDEAAPAAPGKIVGVGEFDGVMDVDHSMFNRILADHVRDERIDYAAIQNGNDAAHLDDYLSMMAEVDVDSLSEAERLAYWINLYNAGMIKAVLEAYPIDNVEEDLTFDVFKRQFIQTQRGPMSLDDIEHETIRKEWDEPRIHAAVVCGAISCPPLTSEVFTAQNIDEKLDRHMVAWLEGDRNEIDHENQTLRLSGIFGWYADDFNNGDPQAYLNENYFDEDISDYEVEYLDYDWSLNDTK